jgi:aminoglycoside/choline kinase family phosphotransferase
MDFSEREVDELIAFFLALRGVGAEHRGASVEAGIFRQRFDLMALQRNLKALGTFGFQTTTRGNPVYIQYIPRTLAYVRNNTERDARLGRLREILSRYVEELR